MTQHMHGIWFGLLLQYLFEYNVTVHAGNDSGLTVNCAKAYHCLHVFLLLLLLWHEIRFVRATKLSDGHTHTQTH